MQKMMPPNAVSVTRLSRETGYRRPRFTTGAMRIGVRGLRCLPTRLLQSTGVKNKLAVVVETAALNETELSVYCRRKRLY